LILGLQDWNYINTSDMALTLELSYPKHPSASTLSSYWNDNRDAMIAYLERVHGPCIYGKTRPGNTIHVQEINHTIKANKEGYYWRLLTSGTWNIKSGEHGMWHKVVVKAKAVMINL